MRREREVELAMYGRRDNEFLNTQIYIVLTTKFKKDAKDAFKTVEEAGYTITKNGNGTWTIRNPHNDKSICVSEEKHSWSKGTYRNFYHINKQCTLSSKIDFVNCLKIDRNSDWFDIIWKPVNESSNAVRIYNDKIGISRRMANLYRKNIEDYQKQITKLQEKMMKASVMIAEYEAKADAGKRELGLM